MIIHRMPEHLIIHLKRFSYVPHPHKIDGFISFPKHFNLGKYYKRGFMNPKKI